MYGCLKLSCVSGLPVQIGEARPRLHRSHNWGEEDTDFVHIDLPQFQFSLFKNLDPLLLP